MSDESKPMLKKARYELGPNTALVAAPPSPQVDPDVAVVAHSLPYLPAYMEQVPVDVTHFRIMLLPSAMYKLSDESNATPNGKHKMVDRAAEVPEVQT